MRWIHVLVITCLISFSFSLGAQGEPKLPSDKELGAILADFEEYAEKGMRDWETPAMALEEYVGNYRNDVYGQINITEKKEDLVLTIGPNKVEIYLTPWNRDTFSICWPFYNDISIPGGFAQFQANPEGAITGVTINLLNDDGCGVFERTAASSRQD